ncbi:GABA transporter 1 [Morella rubra]|uniref:GABA transporter 1 n=1 Tax=Morella rubra TaxID=262757 RepID=A0A6A1WNA5_9ROSI|nr:GABA transporter 1 [Morella rubra]
MEAEAPSSDSVTTVGNGNGVLDPTKELDAGALFVLKSRALHDHASIWEKEVLEVSNYPKRKKGLMAALWVPFDRFYRGSGASDSSLCAGLARLDWGSSLPNAFSFGTGWGKYVIGPLQFGICFAAVIAGALLGGQSLKFIYLLSDPNGTMKLYQFIIIFGVLLLFLAQIPSFHSLRHINLLSLTVCLAYSFCAVAGSIYIGHSKNAPKRDYSVIGAGENRFFGAVNAVSIIATTYASGIIPEIQATIAPPVKGKMFKGLCFCYAITVTTYFSVAISGYWAFGNQAMGTVLSNFMGNEKPLLPTWLLLMINAFTLLQIAGNTVVYLQPTNEVFEKWFADPKMDQFSIRNVVPRLILRSLSVIVATVFAAMLPFFGDVMAIMGAFGFIPLDLIFPMVVYNLTFKPSKRGLVFWGNTLIAVAAAVLSAVGCIASVRQIVIDAKAYRLFANI